MGDILSANELVPVQPGQVVVDLGGNLWVSWANGSSHVGCQIGIAQTLANPGGPILVVTNGRMPYAAFNLGAGNASTITVGSTGKAGRGGQTGGQVIGTCDPAGALFIRPSYVGTIAGGNAPVEVFASAATQASTPASGTAAVWDGQKFSWQNVVSSGGGFPTGTGIVYVTSGSVNPSAVTLTQDVSQGALSGTNVPITVVGAQGKALPALPGAQQFLGYSGSAWNFTTGAAIVSGGLTFANDLAGSTVTNQYVAGISGNGGGGGAVTLGATVVLTAAAGAGGLSLGSWTGSTTLPIGSLTYTGALGAVLSISGGSNSDAVTVGHATINRASFTPTTLSFNQGATVSTVSGVLTITGATQISGFVGATQIALLANGATDYLYLGAQGSNTAAQYLPSGTTFQQSVVTPTLQQTQLAGTGTNAGQGFWIKAQQGQNQTGATNNNAGGNIVLQGGAPGTGGSGTVGTYGGALLYNGAATMIAMGDYAMAPGASPSVYGAIWFATGSPTQTNFGFLGNQSTTYVNVPTGGTVYLSAGGSSGNNAIAFSGQSFSFVPAVAAPVFGQLQPSGTGTTPGTALAVQAQQGQNVASGTNNSGGNLLLKSGPPGTGGVNGNPGNIQLYAGANQALTLDTTTFVGYTYLHSPTTGLYFASGANGIYFVAGGGQIFMDGTLQIQNPGNGNPVWTWSDSDTTTALMTAASTTAGATISQAGITTLNTSGQNFTIQAQTSVNASSTSGKSGDILLNVGTPPGSSATEAFVRFQRGGTDQVWIGADPGAPADFGIWFTGSTAPTGNNYNILANGSQLYLAAPQSVSAYVFQLVNTGSATYAVQLNAATGGLEPGVALSAGTTKLGSNTNPWPSVVGSIYDFPTSISNGLIQWVAAAAAAGGTIQILGQGAGATGNQGGSVAVVGGTGTTTGSGGNVVLIGGNTSTGSFGQVQVAYGGAAPASSNIVAMSLTPASSWAVLHQTAAAANNPCSMVFAPQSPNASSTTQATNTPGSFLVSLAAINTNTVNGLNGAFKVLDSTTNNNNVQFMASNGAAVTSGPASTSMLWLGTGTTAFTPSSTNFLAQSSAGALTLNVASGTMAFAIAGSTYMTLTTGGLGGYVGTSQPLALQTLGIAISISTTATLTASQYVNPILSFNGTLSSNATITLPNHVGAFWICDFSGVTFSTGTVTFSVGAGNTVAFSGAPTSPAKGVVLYVTSTGIYCAF